jgi:hypothetical protein
MQERLSQDAQSYASGQVEWPAHRCRGWNKFASLGWDLHFHPGRKYNCRPNSVRSVEKDADWARFSAEVYRCTSIGHDCTEGLSHAPYLSRRLSCRSIGRRDRLYHVRSSVRLLRPDVHGRVWTDLQPAGPGRLDPFAAHRGHHEWRNRECRRGVAGAVWNARARDACRRRGAAGQAVSVGHAATGRPHEVYYHRRPLDRAHRIAAAAVGDDLPLTGISHHRRTEFHSVPKKTE